MITYSERFFRPFKKLSLRYQFTLIIFFVSAVILFLSHIVYVGLHVQGARERILDQMETQGEIIAYNSRVSLDFGDSVDAKKVLNSLSFRESIRGACLYDENKEIFASYEAVEDIEFPESPGEPGFWFEDGYFYGFIPIINPVMKEEMQLGVLYMMADDRELTSYYNKTIYMAVSLMLIAIFLAYILSVYSQRVLSAPFIDIASAAQKVIRSGDYHARISTSFKNEIDEFAQNFNYIFAQLEESQSNLRESEERFRSYFELGTVGMAVVNPDLEWIALNNVMSQILVGGNDLPGKNWLEFTHAEDREKEEVLLNELLDGKKDHYSLEKRYVVNDDQVLYAVQSVRIVRDSSGDSRYLLLMVEDVSEEHKLDMEKEYLINELKSKNTELESFTYTVSHDLRGPLVTIRGFLHLLEEGMIKGGVDEIQDFINRIKMSAQRMEDLLEDLLKLSRVGRIAELSTWVSMNKLVEQAEEMMHAKVEESKAVIHISEMPDVFGDKSRLYQVWQNLIENSLKFTRDGVAPQIKIGARASSEKGCVFCIQDNGVGIAPDYYDQVFSLFKRLDTRDNGTGVGLTLVKRIIDVHGGDVWIEKNPDGEGVCLCFTISNKDKKDHDSRK